MAFGKYRAMLEEGPGGLRSRSRLLAYFLAPSDLGETYADVFKSCRKPP